MCDNENNLKQYFGEIVRKMAKLHPMQRWLWILGSMLLFGIVASTLAQNDAPEPVQEAAFEAAEAVVGTRALNYRFQLQSETDQSDLGCPLTDGSALPYSVTPYRMEIEYPDGAVYVVFVSADGRIVQPCSENFGAALTVSEPPENACTTSGSAPVYAAPSTAINQVYALGENTRILGVDTLGEWYQVADDTNGLGWVEQSAVSTVGDCTNLPVRGVVNPDPDALDSNCYVTPAAILSNVRRQPSLDAPVVTQIFENTIHEAQARNTVGDWVFIPTGWVSTTVLQQFGTCAALPADDSLIGVGTVVQNVDEIVTPTPIPTATPIPAPVVEETSSVQAVATLATERDARVVALAITFDAVFAAQEGPAGPVTVFSRTDNQRLDTVTTSGQVSALLNVSGQNLVAVATADDRVQLIDPATLAVANTLDGIVNPAFAMEIASFARSVVYAPFGDRIASLSSNETGSSVLTIYDAEGNQQWQETSAAGFTAVRFSPNGRSLATVGRAGVQFWNAETGDLLRTYSNPDGLPINDFVYTPDASQIILVGCNRVDGTTCIDGRVALVDTVEASLLGVLSSHNSAVEAIVYSPSDPRFATTNGFEVIVRNAQSGIELFRYTPEGIVTALAYSPDGSQLFVGLGNGSVQIIAAR